MKSEIKELLHINAFLLQREGQTIAQITRQLAQQKAERQTYLDQLKHGTGEDLASSLQRQKSLPFMIQAKNDNIAGLEDERAKAMVRLSTLVARDEILK